MNIIAFGHRRFVGKDTACNFLITELRLKNVSVEKISFAAQIKKSCFEIFGWAGVKAAGYYEQFPDQKETYIPKIGLTVRELWIKFGTEWCRGLHSDVWVRSAIQNVSADVILISDLRFPNEADCIKSRGGRCIRIDRPSIPKYDDIADSALNGYTGWDKVIPNDGTLKEFYGLIKMLTESI